jgi:hypothetical protein
VFDAAKTVVTEAHRGTRDSSGEVGWMLLRLQVVYLYPRERAIGGSSKRLDRQIIGNAIGSVPHARMHWQTQFG